MDQDPPTEPIVYWWTLPLLYVIVEQVHLTSGAGCSKLTVSLVNVSLKFQTLISETCHYFFIEKM